MTGPVAPVGWTPSLPRCCPQEEFWSFSCSHCNICADFFSYSQCNICISWRISCTGKMQQKNWQIKIVLLVLTDRHVRGKVGRYLPWLGLLLPLIRGAADKVELYFYLHFISLYLYLPKLSTPFDWWEGGLICFHPRIPKIPDTLFCFEILLHCQDCVSPFRRYH